jgi:hypothetical protein
MAETTFPDDEMPSGLNKWLRGGLNALGGAVPVLGGFISAAAGVWGEKEQEEATNAFRSWMKMIQDEMKEKGETLAAIFQRIDYQDEKIRERVKSTDYERLLKKAFRNWAGVESEKKREFIRNILSNAAATSLVDDEVVSLFIDWLQKFSEFHFSVVGELYRNPGSTRADIWEELGRKEVREDSAEADLFKLLIRDLSTGGIIRQHRHTDGQGNFVLSRPKARTSERPSTGIRRAKSAFDDGEVYELTSLGRQFVHYAMTDIPVKIAYRPAGEEKAENGVVKNRSELAA